eukprot:m.466997 g.466997  ORF g.466997 m.466997 type:complete len:217 (-) comp20363_c2_seq15:1297-1947(-)
MHTPKQHGNKRLSQQTQGEQKKATARHDSPHRDRVDTTKDAAAAAQRAADAAQRVADERQRSQTLPGQLVRMFVEKCQQLDLLEATTSETEARLQREITRLQEALVMCQSELKTAGEVHTASLGTVKTLCEAAEERAKRAEKRAEVADAALRNIATKKEKTFTSLFAGFLLIFLPPALAQIVEGGGNFVCDSPSQECGDGAFAVSPAGAVLSKHPW